jgi:ribosome biogenesis GTPase
MRATGVVLVRSGARYRVATDRGQVSVVLRGRVRRADDDRVVPGDVVDLELQADGAGAIVAVHRRRSVLARRAAGGERARRPQPIAANVDQVVLVTATRDPDANARMLDRLLVIAEANGLPAVLVVNKTDLDRAAVAALSARYAAAAYQVLPTSVRSGEGLPAFRDLLRGRESVLAGASGVGKSSLLNAIEPGLGRRVGAISEKWRSGRHTTSAAELLPLAMGGYVVDTPGVREVGTWGLDADGLAACFPEFRPCLDRCRFDDCRHLAEPGCAVRAAAAAGLIDADRLVSYERIHAEVSVPSWSSGRRRAT